jgi:enoyl-CoA hydratase
LTSDDLKVTRLENGAIVRLDIPGGELTRSTASKFSDHCSKIAQDRDIKIVVVSSVGTDFCVGAAKDLGRDKIVPDPASALAAVPVPVIGLFSGKCYSVGLEIALCCDIRVGLRNSTFELSDPGAGILPMWGGTQRLPRAIGTGRATMMLLLGKNISSDVAISWGILHELTDTPEESLEEQLALLLDNGPIALAMAKESVHRGTELPLRDGLRLEGDLNHQLAATQDRAEGLRSFFAKRPPDFSGR